MGGACQAPSGGGGATEAESQLGDWTKTVDEEILCHAGFCGPEELFDVLLFVVGVQGRTARPFFVEEKGAGILLVAEHGVFKAALVLAAGRLKIGEESPQFVFEARLSYKERYELDRCSSRRTHGRIGHRCSFFCVSGVEGPGGGRACPQVARLPARA